MRAIIQRVNYASVTVDGKIISKIDSGLLVLLGVKDGDSEKNADYLAEKITGLRIFTDENDKLNLSLKDVGGKILCVSNFTVYGDCRKGKRPSFITAAKGEVASNLYDYFCDKCNSHNIETLKGIFGADMKVALENDGPITLVIDND